MIALACAVAHQCVIEDRLAEIILEVGLHDDVAGMSSGLLSLVQMACVLIQVVGILKVFVAGISQQVTLVGDQLLLQSQLLH